MDVSVTEFREIVERDSTFSDYFNTFLNLPVNSVEGENTFIHALLLSCRFFLGD